MNAPERALPRANLTVLDGVAIIFGIVFGIGIFKMPSLVASNVDSGTTFMMVWLVGGVATLIGALCYAELATAYPNAGGEYHFLDRAFGRPTAVLFAWARGTVVQTGAIAAVGFAFGDYASQVMPLGPHGSALYAAVAVFLLSAVNLIGTYQSTRVQHLFTALELLAIVVVIGAALAIGNTVAQASTPGSPGRGGDIGLAIAFVLFTFGGWNEAAYISAELRDGRRNIPRVLVAAIVVLVLVYGVMNFAYLHVFGLEGLRATQAPAAELMRLAGGSVGALLISLIICCAALSTLNATILTGGRTYYALGRDLPILQRLGIWDARGENPANGILIQGALALALVLFGAATRDGFQAMVDYTLPVFWFFMLLVGVGLFVLRWREPGRERPFRVPLYPVTPLIFCATCAYLLYSSLAYTGLGALVGIAVLAAGAPLLLIGRAAERTMPAE